MTSPMTAAMTSRVTAPMTSRLTPGAVLPDFELPDETGARHRLSDLQGDDALVLMLARGEHCPRERQQQREMLAFHTWCSVAFTRLVTVVPNDLHVTGRLKSSTGAHWTFLADVEYEVQQTLDIAEYTDPHNRATVPHTLVVAPGLVIDTVHVGYWFWGRPSPYRLWDDLADMFRRTKADFDPTTPEARAAWSASQASAAQESTVQASA